MNNKKGLTLIELVIVLALIGILSSLLFFPILFSFDNFEKQSNTVNEISTARSTMELLTKEIRKSDKIEVEGNALVLDTVVYKLDDKALKKNGQLLFGGIEELNFSKVGEIVTIQVKIKKANGQDYELSSIVNLR